MDTITMNNSLIEESENLKKILDERLEIHDNSRRAAQDKLHEICEGLRNQINEFENKINNELEGNFNKEDSRLQSALSNLRGIDMDKLNDDNINKLQKAIRNAKAELLVTQLYDIVEREEEIQKNDEDIGDNSDVDEDYGDDDLFDNDSDDNEHYEEPAMKKRKVEVKTYSDQKLSFTNKWELKVDRKLIPETLGLRKPKDTRITNNNNDGKISIQFSHLNTDEKNALSKHNLMDQIKYKCLLSKKESDVNDKQNNKEYILNETGDFFTVVPNFLESKTTYEVKVKVMFCDNESEWSDETAGFTTPGFKECCAWKECPNDVEEQRKYTVDENNPKIATKVDDGYYGTIVVNISIPFNKVTSWNIKILKSERNNGSGIYIGVVPFDINQNEDENYKKCGWYFSCYSSRLYSGPPHNYDCKEYGPRKDYGKYVHTGDNVGVMMDTTKGELSFVLDGVNLGVAFEGIPLDKPLVPCVIIYYEGDSVELMA